MRLVSAKGVPSGCVWAPPVPNKSARKNVVSVILRVLRRYIVARIHDLCIHVQSSNNNSERYLVSGGLPFPKILNVQHEAFQ